MCMCVYVYITDYCCHTSRWVELPLTHTHTAGTACSHSRPGLLCSGQNCMLTFLIRDAVFRPKRYAHIPDQVCWLPANSVYTHIQLNTKPHTSLTSFWPIVYVHNFIPALLASGQLCMHTFSYTMLIIRVDANKFMMDE